MKPKQYVPDPRYVAVTAAHLYDVDFKKSGEMELHIRSAHLSHCELHHIVQAVCPHGDIVLDVGMDKVRDVCHGVVEDALRSSTSCKCTRKIVHSATQQVLPGPLRKPVLYVAKSFQEVEEQDDDE